MQGNILYLKRDVIDKTENGFNLFESLSELFFDSKNTEYITISLNKNIEIPNGKYTQHILMFLQTSINTGYSHIIFELK